ncbi:uncharacterized protein C8Q71DRAFT_393711 [Rhodofomes roseus]|uniref:Uncharacterized protein n=1 Tax=Rhodofomes roseus TaxID=34475 RepID=A0ABQ8JZV6_9APHY|nr:uncharacterized protein C8Q71DRAFT_393711 [Rhodofomes roseus]KAH9829901.1 hypothetical protein C8Q71DRAFT_393711 [Rhodofomes roseus]
MLVRDFLQARTTQDCHAFGVCLETLGHLHYLRGRCGHRPVSEIQRRLCTTYVQSAVLCGLNAPQHPCPHATHTMDAQTRLRTSPRSSVFCKPMLNTIYHYQARRPHTRRPRGAITAIEMLEKARDDTLRANNRLPRSSISHPANFVLLCPFEKSVDRRSASDSISHPRFHQTSTGIGSIESEPDRRLRLMSTGRACGAPKYNAGQRSDALRALWLWTFF